MNSDVLVDTIIFHEKKNKKGRRIAIRSVKEYPVTGLQKKPTAAFAVAEFSGQFVNEGVVTGRWATAMYSQAVSGDFSLDLIK